MCDRTNFSSRKSFVHFFTPQRHRSPASLVTAPSISFFRRSSMFTPPSFVTSESSGLINMFSLSVQGFWPESICQHDEQMKGWGTCFRVGWRFLGRWSSEVSAKTFPLQFVYGIVLADTVETERIHPSKIFNRHIQHFLNLLH